MGLPQAKPYFTVEEYVERELRADIKHEYDDGEILAMSGGSPEHSLIAMNIARAIGSRLGAGPCRVYDSNLRIRIPVKPAKYLYGDATIICGAFVRDEEDPSGQSV